MIELTTMIFKLISSDPEGIRICHVEGESLTTVVVPRGLLSEAKNLPEIPKRGIYYLLDEDHGIISRVYAGQTTQGLARLDSHKSKKGFWNKAVMFLDNESNMNRDVLDALEAEAIGYTRTHGSYENDNLATPQPYIDPYKEQTVKKLHKNILFRMAVLGYRLDRSDTAVAASPMLFHTKRRGIVASGYYDELTGRFTVLSGSQIDLSRSITKNRSAVNERRKLFGEASGVAILQDDASFNSPSMAAVFVLSGSQDGLVEWVNEAGETLKVVYGKLGIEER